MKALQKSIDVRNNAKLDLRAPLDVYTLCERLRIKVRFVGISMEGMYKRGSPPNILISALRPQPRRAFTCAHELGHHVFGHGSTIDELVDESAKAPFLPDEFLVQAFAGFLLMPPLGVRRAFTQRGWAAADATPAQLYVVACSFGVGFTTMVSHLAYSLDMLDRSRVPELLRIPLARVRRDLLGTASSNPLIVVDDHWALPTVDAEVGTQIILPPGVMADGDLVASRADTAMGGLYEAVRPGIMRATKPASDWAVFVRVSRHQYKGLSQYRHLEDDDPDDEDEDDD
jgi:IrrE N-terminal-like domain